MTISQKESPRIQYEFSNDKNRIWLLWRFLKVSDVKIAQSQNSGFLLTLTRLIGLPPHAPVAQKIADQRWLIANSANKKYLFL